MEKAEFFHRRSDAKSNKKSSESKLKSKFLQESAEKKTNATNQILARISKYFIFIAICGAIIFGSVFTYLQLEEINTTVLSDTKRGIKNSIENQLEVTEKRIFTIADSYTAYYSGSLQVEQHEFEDFSRLILRENPLITSVYAMSENEIVRAFPDNDEIGISIDHLISQNSQNGIPYLVFALDGTRHNHLLMKINPALLVNTQAQFPSNYKFELASKNEEISYSIQRINDEVSYPAIISKTEQANSVELIKETELVVYGYDEPLLLTARIWESSFEDNENAYQIIILLGGSFTGITVLFLLIRSYRLRMQVEEKTEKLLKTERLASIGQLSARMAHDFNNPLSIIKNSVEILKRQNKIQNSNMSEFDRIDRAVSRISHQVNNVLDFVKGRKLNLQDTSLLETIQTSISSIKVPKRITISIPQKDVKLLADPSLLGIVFDNLLLNAIQAMGESGHIRINWNKAGEGLSISVQDTGEGISKDVMPKIFEPLFTTKHVGTGLGLTSCKSIMEQHGGSIEVSVNPTTMILKFPKTMVLES